MESSLSANKIKLLTVFFRSSPSFMIFCLFLCSIVNRSIFKSLSLWTSQFLLTVTLSFNHVIWSSVFRYKHLGSSWRLMKWPFFFHCETAFFISYNSLCSEICLVRHWFSHSNFLLIIVSIVYFFYPFTFHPSVYFYIKCVFCRREI